MKCFAVLLAVCLVGQALAFEKAKEKLKDAAEDLMSDGVGMAAEAYEYAKEKLIDAKDVVGETYEQVSEAVKERWTQASHDAADKAQNLKEAAADKVNTVLGIFEVGALRHKVGDFVGQSLSNSSCVHDVCAILTTRACLQQN